MTYFDLTGGVPPGWPSLTPTGPALGVKNFLIIGMPSGWGNVGFERFPPIVLGIRGCFVAEALKTRSCLLGIRMLGFRYLVPSRGQTEFEDIPMWFNVLETRLTAPTAKVSQLIFRDLHFRGAVKALRWVYRLYLNVLKDIRRRHVPSKSMEACCINQECCQDISKGPPEIFSWKFHHRITSQIIFPFID